MSRSRRRPRELETTVEPLPGRDDWLFLTGDRNDVIAQHTGSWVPGRAWKRRWARLLRGRARRLRRLGAEWVFLVSPDKEAVYADKLPPQVSPVERRPIHRLLELADDAGVEIIYPQRELVSASAGQLVYFPTDTHWTARAGYLAYRLICAALIRRGVEPEVVGEERLAWNDFTLPGDLGAKLDPPVEGPGTSLRVRTQHARTVSDNRIAVTGRRMVFERDSPGAPSCVLFGSSYAMVTLPLFAESFRRLVYVHTTSHDIATVRAERPDAVITLTSERGLRRVPDDRRAHGTLAETIARKRESGLLVDEDEPRRRGMPPP